MSSISMGEVLGFVGGAIEQIGALVGGDVGATAVAVVKTVKGIVDAINAVTAGKITPADAQEGINQLVAQLKSNDAAMDAAMAAKFPRKD